MIFKWIKCVACHNNNETDRFCFLAGVGSKKNSYFFLNEIINMKIIFKNKKYSFPPNLPSFVIENILFPT